MCNLYRMSSSYTELARLFAVPAPETSNAGKLIYPGLPGIVLANGALRSMTWGFPLSRRGKSGQALKPKPVNNTRTDKLDSRFWNANFRDRRALIPVTAFAEAEGPRGTMTRTWFADPTDEMLTCAGIWRDSAEWGPVYSMLMTDANSQVKPVHDRMPVIIAAADRATYVNGAEDDAHKLCEPYATELAIDRTNDPWVRRS
ncbi:SOS response-associated peptidase family protein [Alteripontixanthobacter maritimus]|nr:SOS response-associated peptidase family protein [Alteripontixanthobacter maritimus]